MSVLRFRDDPPRHITFERKRVAHRGEVTIGGYVRLMPPRDWGSVFGSDGSGNGYEFQRRGAKVEIRVGSLWCAWSFRWVGRLRLTKDVRSRRQRQIDREIREHPNRYAHA